MKRIGVLLVLVTAFLAVPGVSEAATGSIIGWGCNTSGECSAPAPNYGFVDVSVWRHYSLALRENGSIEAWGENEQGQCEVPSPNSDFAAVAAGQKFGLGLKEDGSIIGWGRNEEGQCNVSTPNSGFVALTAGCFHCLGLKSDASIRAWGNNSYGQGNIPSPNSNYTAVSAGGFHSLAVKSDGSIRAWGFNYYGQCNIPSPNSGFVAISAGEYFSVGLKSDGSIVAWGDNGWGQCNVPAPNSDFEMVASGGYHSLALKNLIVITQPNSSTTWTHFDTDLSIGWAGKYSSTVSVAICKGTVLVETLAGYASNTGSYVFEGPVPRSWSPGTDYRIYIEDGAGHSSWSAYFTVAPSQGAEVITVTEPDAATTWNNINLNRTISWNYPALINHCSGDTVSIKLYKNGVFIEELISSTPNTGELVYSDSLPASLETGSDYTVRVVDNFDNYGSCVDFTIDMDTAINNSDYFAFDPDEPCLFPVSPNPSIGLFTINYFIPRASDATVSIYDVAGKMISEAATGQHSPGLYQIQDDGLASGVYFCHLRTGSDSMTERFVVIR